METLFVKKFYLKIEDNITSSSKFTRIFTDNYYIHRSDDGSYLIRTEVYRGNDEFKFNSYYICDIEMFKEGEFLGENYAPVIIKVEQIRETHITPHNLTTSTICLPASVQIFYFLRS